MSAFAATLAKVWVDVKCWKERLQQVQHRFFQDPGGSKGTMTACFAKRMLDAEKCQVVEPLGPAGVGFTDKGVFILCHMNALR